MRVTLVFSHINGIQVMIAERSTRQKQYSASLVSQITLEMHQQAEAMLGVACTLERSTVTLEQTT
jgi:hypothetical protein